jgi:hypothetical protein
MSKADEEIIRTALNDLAVFEKHEGVAVRFSHPALLALERLTSRTVPELPEGWTVKEISPDFGGWICWIQKWNGDILIDQHQGSGETIRDACESAIKKIGEQACGPCL